MKRYTSEEISSIISCYGYKLVEFNSSTNIIAIDDEGYKYKINLCNLKGGMKPNKFMRNPYALENVKLFLFNNYPDYELLDDEYYGCKTKMNFICNKHRDKGVQENTIDNIINNHHVCKYCSYEKLRDIKILNIDKVKKLCNDKNVIYEGRYTKDHESYIQYSCEKHRKKGVQDMSLTHFKYSHVPCKYCNISSGELKISNYLDNNNIEYESEKIFKECVDIHPLRFDFYLPDKNIIIEFDGKQHFEPVCFWHGIDAEKCLESVKRRDKIKNDYCYNNNIKLIRIPYWEYDNIDKILASEL